MRIRRSVFTTLVALSIPASCWAVDATLVGDTYISSTNSSANYGALPGLNVGGGATTLLSFSLASLPSILTPSSVLKANLVLYVNRVGVQGNMVVAPILGPWSESTVTYMTNPGQGSAIGSPNAAMQTGQYLVIDVTSTVQGWITVPASNYGFAVSADPGSPSANIILDSKESTSTSHAPRLDITFATTDPNVRAAICALYSLMQQTAPGNLNCAALCSDATKDGNETDVDCGGGTCGACTPGKSCKTGTDCTSGVCSSGVCTVGVCTPKTCAQLNANCGSVSDGCGGTLSCGSCASPQTCGGSGVANVCGTPVCTPKTCAQLNANCGSVSDCCGGTLSCGSCASPQTCGGSGVANVCGTPVCTPKTCAQLNASCGSVSDGCGGTLSCGSCASPQTCGGSGVANVCGTPVCTPKTCAQLNANCGSVSDVCGGTLSCGSCASPQTCGGSGVANVCGTPVCTPKTCAQLNANCGSVSDGCGGTLSCGSCASPQTCGGSGVANVCG